MLVRRSGNRYNFSVYPGSFSAIHGRFFSATDSTLTSGLFSLPFARLCAADDSVRGDTPEATAFIAGVENALVRSLVKAAISEFLSCNPLVLCGGPGTGKSSVAETLAARRRQQFGLSNAIATTGADLAIALADAIERDAVADFRSRYHRCDILFVDDAHRLAGKAAAQQFLLTAIDSLVHRGALVIVTLRRHPQATARLTPQLASRLAGGLVVNLATPGLLARQEIVRQAAASSRLRLTDDEVSYLAGNGGTEHATSAKIRRAVLELAAATEFDRHTSRPEVLRAIFSRSPDSKMLYRFITIAVARHFAVPAGELKGKSRRKTVADARGLAMYLARRLTGASYAQIGRYFGGRDHTTVLHACRKTAAAVADDPSFAQIAEELVAQAAAEGVD